jgi:hypothetical protein
MKELAGAGILGRVNERMKKLSNERIGWRLYCFTLLLFWCVARIVKGNKGLWAMWLKLF